MSDRQSLTGLPGADSPPEAANPANPARAAQEVLAAPMVAISAVTDELNYGVAKLTGGISRALPSFPAARLWVDMVFGWPHYHMHPPNLTPPAPPIFLPSIGPAILSGALNVLINGFPSARCGDVGFGAWCGGFYPLFEVFTGSSNVFIGGARASRMLIDFTRHCSTSFFKKKPKYVGKHRAKPGKHRASPGKHRPKPGKHRKPLDMEKIGLAIAGGMAGYTGLMGGVGVAAAETDMANALQAAEEAQTESEAAAAMADAEASALEASMTAAQTAADLAAMALSFGMGMDPGEPPLLCFGNFITGSHNVLIGGIPMPGWETILSGLGKMFKPVAERIQMKVPEGSLRSQLLCLITGHPVDIATGRVFTSQTDFELPGRIPVEFTRIYDSSAIDYEGPLGRGWTHPYDIHLWEDERQQMVILRTEEGVLLGFDLIGVGEKAFNPLEKRWLERPDEKVYVVRGKDGARYKFSPAKERDSAIEAVDDLEGKSEATALRLSEIEDRNGNRIGLFYERGRLGWLEDAAGTRVNFSYITLDNGAVRLAGMNLALDGDSGRTAKLVNFTYDSEGRLTNATDRGLMPWRYAYDGDLLIRETNRNGLSFHFAYKGGGKEARCVHTWGDGGIYERWLDYDREARMTVVENSLGARTRYYFNELDLPVRIVDAMGGERKFSYGPNGELLSKTDQIGCETKYLYNSRLDCISIIRPDGTARRFDYSRDSLPERLTDEAGAEFRREYDERGNITATIDALGHRREYDYNQFGDLERAVDPLGGATKFKWNERGRITEFTTPLGARTIYSYDEWGRLGRVNDPLGHATRYAYDALDRMVWVERPDGTRNRYEYDPEGNLTNFLDANGAETRFRYVDYNKLGVQIDALGYTRRYAYNTEANLVEVRNERGEGHRFTYDALDRVTREVGFDDLRWEYNYDPAGQLIARTDPAGRVTRLVRDLQGRVIERRRPDGSAISFSYDRVGRLAETDAPGSELQYKYDALGRVIWESQNGQVIEHEYDAVGRRIKRRSPSGQVVEFTYDADGQLSSLQTPRGAMEFEYDKARRMTKRRMPGELEESLYYDQCGRIIEQWLDKPRQTLFHRGYKYDFEGNLIELADSKKGTSRFAYDPVERLREVTQPERKIERFVYDSTGNLLHRGGREFRYDQPDRLTRADGATLVYDGVGNLIEKRRAGSVIRYSYDTDNRLIAVESEEGGRVEFAYDALGRRTAKKTKDGETGFLWDGDVLLAERRTDKSDLGIIEYVNIPGSFLPLARVVRNGEGPARIESYHVDYLGTPREVTGEKGELVWEANYDVYGRAEAPKGEVAQPIRFQGQYEDVETGLHYNRFRYYDSESGRYVNKDPIGLAGGLNPYEYTHNPINWVDPLGLSPSRRTPPEGRAERDAMRDMAYEDQFLDPHDLEFYGRPHANSLDATGPHDVYAIRYVGGRDDLGIKPGTVLHYGETGRGYRTRGVEWARFFREEYGFLVESVRLTTVEGKRAAREQETRRIQIFERLFGHKPGFFTPDGQFVQTQKSCH
jgi:RHS repeat-associated protein